MIRETPRGASVRTSPRRILAIGLLPPPLGGARVWFGGFSAWLAAHPGVEARIVSLLPQPHVRGVKRILLDVRTLLQIVRHAPFVDVIALHASKRGTLLVGPIVWLLGRLLRKKTVLREFGGSFADEYAAFSTGARALMQRTVLDYDLVMLQTQQLVEAFRPLARNVEWHANCRELPVVRPRSAEADPTQLRCVFLGHVKPSKGVRDIVTAMRHVTGNVTVDFYGPLKDGVSADELNTERTTYCGSLDRDAVLPTLAKYDVLLLPTTHYGEGYPGVILEAFTVGLAVIASRWQAIPELVTEDVGLLVEPNSVIQLAEAIEQLDADREQLEVLKAGAWQRAALFSAERWHQIYLDYIEALF